jgi:hypothetical protein
MDNVYKSQQGGVTTWAGACLAGVVSETHVAHARACFEIDA